MDTTQLNAYALTHKTGTKIIAATSEDLACKVAGWPRDEVTFFQVTPIDGLVITAQAKDPARESSASIRGARGYL